MCSTHLTDSENLTPNEVPFDKPKESLALIQRWLSGEAI